MKGTYAALSAFVMVASMWVGVQTQTAGTIPEALARGGGWVFPSGPDGIPPSASVSALLRRTDTIVRGTVGTPGPSYLSEDQRDVYTDYPIQSPTVLYQAVPKPSPMPAFLPSVTVTVRGGAMVINGRPFTARYHGQPELVPGEEYLFLLREMGGKYRVASDYYGVFAAVAGRLVPSGSRPYAFDEEYGGMTASGAIEKIVALAYAQRGERR